MQSNEQTQKESAQREAKERRAVVLNEREFVEWTPERHSQNVERLNEQREFEKLNPVPKAHQWYVDACKRQSAESGELSLRKFFHGDEAAGRYFAAHAYNLARNAVNVENAGEMKTDGFMEYVREQEAHPDFANGKHKTDKEEMDEKRKAELAVHNLGL